MSQDVDIKGLRVRATSGARWTGSATAIRLALQFVQIAILARLLRVEDFGLMAMVNVVLAFGQTFADSGVSNAIIHYRDAKREELSSLYWLNVVSGIVVFAVMWFVAPLAAQVYRQPPLTDLLRVSSVIFVIGPLGQQFQALFERTLRFKRLAAIEAGAIVSSSAAGIALAFMGFGVWSLVWATIANTVVKAGVLAAVGWNTWRPMLHFVPRECRRFLRFGIYQMGERTLNLVGQHVDKLVIGIVMGPVPLGYYDAASRLVQRPYQIINPVFTRVAYPVFSSVQKDRDRLRKGYLELMEVLSGLTIPVYVGMAALATPFILVQYSAKFLPTVQLLQIMCIAGLGFALNSPAGSMILALGRADVGFYLNVLRTALVLAGIWIASPWGPTGIAWALVIVVVVVMFPVHVWVRRRLVGMTFREFMATVWPYLWASAAAAGVVIAGQRFIAWPNAVVELVVLLLVAAGVYVGLLWWRARARVMRIIRLARS